MKLRTILTILILSLMLKPFVLFAQFTGGTGEPNDPYQIATAEQLLSIGSDPNLFEKNFVMVADIDLDPNLPGGSIFKNSIITQDESDSVGGHTGPSFEGIFDGNGYTISNLHIEGEYGYDAGLFGKLSGLVKDLNLTDVVVSGSPCGAIAGLNHRGMILRCSVTGQISGAENVGGLVGSNWEASIVECESKVQVTGVDNVGGMVGNGPGGTIIRCEAIAEITGDRNVGGLFGSGHDGQIIECRAIGVVIGNDFVGGLIGSSDKIAILRSSSNCNVTSERIAGGLIGSAHWLPGPLILDCYTLGSITGSIVGGIAGVASHNQFMNCYAACNIVALENGDGDMLVGGLFGDTRTSRWTPIAVSCFWDSELSGVTNSTGSNPQLEIGTGLKTEQMWDETLFRNSGLDLKNVWVIQEGDYPKLKWEVE